jgi:hypothetical protein
MTSISDLSDSISAGQTLSTPLRSNLPEHEGGECEADCYEEEEGRMPCPLKISISNEELDEISGGDNSQSSWWNDNFVASYAFLLWQLGMITISNEELDEVSGGDSSQASWWNDNFVALYAFLVWQLGMGLYIAGTEATVTTGLCWSLVNCRIVLLFFGISILCHQAIKDCKMICTVVLLAPQILVIIILGDQSVATKATVVMGLCWSLFSEVIVVFVVIATAKP